MNCHVNLIPVNPIKERSYVQPDHEAILKFKNRLEKMQFKLQLEGNGQGYRRCMRTIAQTLYQSCRKVGSREDEDVFHDAHRAATGNESGLYVYIRDCCGKSAESFLVADGMGGHAAGDYASRFTVEKLVELIGKSVENEPVAIMKSAVSMANSLLLTEAQADPAKNGMGTTIVAATVIGNTLYAANVGDSRLYVINQEDITQITRIIPWLRKWSA